MQSGQCLSRLRIALGTFVAIEAEAASASIAERGIEAAFEAVGAVDRLMHPARPGSDIAALNDARGAWVAVHEWTWEVLELCDRVHRASGGIFDPCLDIAAGRWPDIERRADRLVRSRLPASVDLGGIAKGYAVDRAIEALRTSGCHAGLVNAGGDLAVFGGCARTILTREGPEARHAFLLSLRDGALATSTADRAPRPSEHRGHYHGRTREALLTGSVSVMAPCAAVADALTKCMLFADARMQAALLATFGARRIETAAHPEIS